MTSTSPLRAEIPGDGMCDDRKDGRDDGAEEGVRCGSARRVEAVYS